MFILALVLPLLGGCVVEVDEALLQAMVDAEVTRVLEEKGCVTEEALAGYATTDWVGAQGYVSDVSGLVTDTELAAVVDQCATDGDVSEALATYATGDDLAVLQGIVDGLGGTYATDVELAALASTLDALDATYATDDQLANGLSGTLATAEGYCDDAVDSVAVRVDDAELRIDYLEDLTVDLDDLLAYVDVDTSANAVSFVGANVYVQSGSGATMGTVNGLGNLIVGYDEDEYSQTGEYSNRAGSHNLIVGPFHSYASYGGLIAGYQHHSLSDFASLLGGTANDVTSSHGVVIGGSGNLVAGTTNGAAVGGYGNAVGGSYAVAIGGTDNLVSGTYSLSAGGTSNTASGESSLAAGGSGNLASGQFATASGGANNSASGTWGGVSGGYLNVASGPYSSVCGGNAGEASGYGAAVSGGVYNVASGQVSSVAGGSFNTADGLGSAILGGYTNTVSGSTTGVGAYAVVVGGQGYTAVEEMDVGPGAW